jgi:hypothetical protein
LTLAEDAGERVLRAQALRLIGDTWRYTEFHRFVALTEEAHGLFSDAGDHANAAECARILAYLMSTSTSPRYRQWRKAAELGLTDRDVRGHAWLARADVWALAARREYARAAASATEAIRLGELIGAADCIADGLSVLTLARTATGDLEAAAATYERFRRFAVANANPRMRLFAGSVGAVALLRHGRRSEAVDEIATALDQVDGFGLSERYTLSMAAARLSADRGRWAEAARQSAVAIQAAAAASFTLLALEARLLEARVHLQLSQLPSSDHLVLLERECLSAEAPALATYAASIRAQITMNPLDSPVAGVHQSAEDVAMRTETLAVVAESTGHDASDAWRAAAEAWRRLGYTVWLARAQARSGDAASAEETLQAVGADDDARAWAFGERPR